MACPLGIQITAYQSDSAFATGTVAGAWSINRYIALSGHLQEYRAAGLSGAEGRALCD